MATKQLETKPLDIAQLQAAIEAKVQARLDDARDRAKEHSAA